MDAWCQWGTQRTSGLTLFLSWYELHCTLRLRVHRHPCCPSVSSRVSPNFTTQPSLQGHPQASTESSLPAGWSSLGTRMPNAADCSVLGTGAGLQGAGLLWPQEGCYAWPWSMAGPNPGGTGFSGQVPAGTWPGRGCTVPAPQGDPRVTCDHPLLPLPLAWGFSPTPLGEQRPCLGFTCRIDEKGSFCQILPLSKTLNCRANV